MSEPASSGPAAGALARPVPVPDERSAGFWAAAARHQLTASCCDHCGWLAYPPTIVCHRCSTVPAAFHDQPVSGRGRLVTWTVLHTAFLPAFAPDLPYVVADVELVEQPGLRLVAYLLDGPEADLALGAPIEVVFEDVEAGVAVPRVRLVGRP